MLVKLYVNTSDDNDDSTDHHNYEDELTAIISSMILDAVGVCMDTCVSPDEDMDEVDDGACFDDKESESET